MNVPDDDGPGDRQADPAVRDEASRKAANIHAELAGLDDGTDPFTAAVRVTRMPMIITDPNRDDNAIVFANDAFCRFTGYPRHEILGQNCRFLQGPDTDPETVHKIRAAIEAVEPIEIDIRNYTKSGRPFWNRLLIAPVLGTNGKVAYFFASQFDVTAERESLADRTRELAQANDKLLAEAVERERIEDALRQSQKMEAVGQLTGGLAHDFNNLLAGISGSLEILQRRLAQGRLGDFERYITAAQDASARAASLTHRLLAFSRRQTLAPKVTDVNRLITGLEELVRRTMGPQITVEVRAEARLWTTLIDPNQLENALLNLCINARDAMPESGRLTIETANRQLDSGSARDGEIPPGQFVVLHVSDTGSGMTPEVARRAFDPFFTTKPIGLGTGLGLSMIYGFVRQSGGHARIHSAPGHGTRVCLYLPRHTDGTEAVADGSGTAAGLRADASRTVLVVDDEPTVRMLVADVLEDLGYVTIAAADGNAGVQVLRSDTRVDLLVTDVGLPGGLNGRQVADAGRLARPGLKVLFITGYAEHAVLGNGVLEPGMDVLTKPFSIDALAARITAMIEAE